MPHWQLLVRKCLSYEIIIVILLCVCVSVSVCVSVCVCVSWQYLLLHWKCWVVTREYREWNEVTDQMWSVKYRWQITITALLPTKWTVFQVYLAMITYETLTIFLVKYPIIFTPPTTDRELGHKFITNPATVIPFLFKRWGEHWVSFKYTCITDYCFNTFTCLLAEAHVKPSWHTGC